MLVPYYWNKKSIDKTYENNDYKWVSLDKFLTVLNEEVLKDFEDLDWFDLVNEFLTTKFKEKYKKYPPVNIEWDNFVDFKDFLFSAKLLFMTGFTCQYWFWKKWWLNELGSGKVYTHHGVDLILPKWTPIVSFSSWDVFSAQYANGYGNYVVIRSKINWEVLYFCYEHLEDIKVQKWEKVTVWDTIWTCWNSWRAYWYHLHFQIDKDIWNFHPYWSSWENDVEKTLKNCIDPWLFLRKHYLKNTNLQTKEQLDDKTDNSDMIWALTKQVSEKQDDIQLASYTKEVTKKQDDVQLASYTKDNKNSKTDTEENIELLSPNDTSSKNEEDIVTKISQDLSSNSSWGNYIDFFLNAGILKWDKWNYLLNKFLTRYQVTLILYRLYKIWLLHIKDNKTNCNKKFKDITIKLKQDEEFLKAIDFVTCNGILKWDNGKFLPWNSLTWEQFLAIIWRLFAGLENSTWARWYDTYYNWAVDKKIISPSWSFIGSFITRREVFRILHKLILS